MFCFKFGFFLSIHIFILSILTENIAYAKSSNQNSDTDLLLNTDGPYVMVKDSFSDDKNNPDYKLTYIFRPLHKENKSPAIIFCHQITDNHYEKNLLFINYLVSMGFVVIYPSSYLFEFAGNAYDHYNVSIENIENIVYKNSFYIDTTRIGFFGHSTGAGALPALAFKLFNEKHWGNNGIFLYLSNPWYIYSIDNRKLNEYPQIVNLVIQTYENNYYNDPEIAVDIFNKINIPNNQKRMFIVKNDKISRFRQKDLLIFPEQFISDSENYLNLMLRNVEALANYTFFNDTDANKIIFGSVDKASDVIDKTTSDRLCKPFIITDSPDIKLFKKSIYINPWLSFRNPLLESKDYNKSRIKLLNYHKKVIKSITAFFTSEIMNNVVGIKKKSIIDNYENPITSGYGSNGSYNIQKDTISIFDNAKDRFSDPVQVYFFTPVEKRSPSPVIIFIHGYIGQNPDDFEPLINHIVSKGYTVIYPTYSFFPKADDKKTIIEKYNQIYTGIFKASRILSWRIDTTRVGFFGQSFGAGAIPAVAYRILNNQNWGQNGAFMFITAPWYSFDITEQQIKNFPEDVKLILQVYNDDQVNDHAMAIDLFNSLPIPKSEKEYMIVYSDNIDGYELEANHFVPYGPKNVYGELNHFDFFGIYRIFDALAAYSFTGNNDAKIIALGNDSIKEYYMGELDKKRPFHPAILTDLPTITHSEKHYLYDWNNTLNPRIQTDN